MQSTKLLYVLICTLALLSNATRQSVKQHHDLFQSGLVPIETAQSRILFITSADGKIYAYDMEKHSLLWLTDTNMTFQELRFHDDAYFQTEPLIIIPTFDGNVILYSKDEGYHRFTNSEIYNGLQACFTQTETKYFSRVTEQILILDMKNGDYWNFNNRNLQEFNTRNMNDFGFIKIKQYYFNAFDISSMQEKWSLVTSDIDFYTHSQFMMSGNLKNPNKFMQDYTLNRQDTNNLEIIRDHDESVLRNIQTEEDIIGLHSLDTDNQIFSVKTNSLDQKIIEKMMTQHMGFDFTFALPFIEDGTDSTEIQVYDSHGEAYSIVDNNVRFPNQFEFSEKPSIFQQLTQCIIDLQKPNIPELPDNSDPTIPITDDNNDSDPTEPIDNGKKDAEFYQYFTYGLTAVVSLLLGDAVYIRVFKAKQKSEQTKTVDDSSKDSQDSQKSDNSQKEKKKEGESNGAKKPKKESSQKKMFEIYSKEVLGLGSHGTVVYNGEFQGMNVAIKRFVKNYFHTAKAEIDVFMKMEHPNIIKYMLYQEDNDFLYLILERCLCSMKELVESFHKLDNAQKASLSKFKSLQKQKIRSQFPEKSLPFAAIKRLMLECANGIDFLHQKGIVHRDIKPENILLSQNLNVKIADFGISKVLDDQQQKFLSEVGSFGWKAPEMITQKEKTKSVDIFSLGCTFYYLLTNGKHPFGEMNDREHNILNGSYNLKDLKSYEQKHLIESMIQKDPKKRYTIKDVLNHPFFWDEFRKLNFLQEFSDYIESHDPNIGKDFEEYAQEKQAIPYPWDKKLEQCLIRDLINFRQYNFRSARELLRVIRNKKNHYYELPADTRMLLGKMPEGIWNYFDTRFPKILIYSILYCQEANLPISYLSYKFQS